MSDQTQTPRSNASRYHHTELSRRAQFGISLGWASLVLLLAGSLSYTGNSTLTPSVKVLLGLGILLGAGYLAIRKEAACAAVFNARTGSLANSTVAILAVLGILGFANYIAARHNRQFDITRNQLHTLSPQTRDVLKGLKEPVTITAFYQLSGRGGMEGQQARDLLQQYRDAAPQKVKFELIDPVANPAQATAKGVTNAPIIWVECGGRREEVYTAGETEITSAVLKAANPQQKKVYFLFGHGEHDIDANDIHGMSDARMVLEKLNYAVAKLVLPTVKQIPDDATVIVAAGPAKGIPANEQQMLAAYLKRGGKLLLMLDPKAPVPTALLQPWGVQVGNDVVIDPRIRAGISIVEQFETHQISKNLQLGIFPLARSVSPAANPPGGVSVTSLAKTSSMAWGETKLNGPFQQDAADMPGPVSLAVVATRDQGAAKQNGRLVVFGDSDFATQQLFMSRNSSDGDLFLNAINWLAEEDALVNIRPKEPDQSQIMLIDSQARWLFLTTVLLVPLGVLLAGVGVWWRRR